MRGRRNGLRKRVVAMFREGVTYQEIAAAVGASYQTVVNHITVARRADPTIPRQKRKGNNGTSVRRQRGGRTLTERVIDLHRAGWTSGEIAVELDTTPKTVMVLLSRARRKDASIGRSSRVPIFLSEDERQRVEFVAAQHDVQPSVLARSILMRVLDEGLTPIVLGGDPGRVLRRAA